MEAQRSLYAVHLLYPEPLINVCIASQGRQILSTWVCLLVEILSALSGYMCRFCLHGNMDYSNVTAVWEQK